MTTTAEAQTLVMQLLDPSARANPYPLYEQIREHGPLHMPDSRLTVFSSFADCDEVLRHPASASDSMKSSVVQEQIAQGAEMRPLGPPGFLFLDPPDHTRLRGLVSKAFVPRVVNALEPDITALVDGLLDAIERRGSFDVIADLAYPLPVAVICRLLGVPIEDEPEFSRASALLAQGLDPFSTLNSEDPERAEKRQEAGRWLREYLRGLIDVRRGALREDLISGLIAAEEGGDQLTEEEIVATCNLLLIAGHETTVNLIANAMLAMLREPSLWRALASDPSRAGAVVEETMRYDPPVQLVMRIASEDMTIGSVDIPKGDSMLLLIAASHRDPAVAERPGEFDPDRATIRHLGFGKGRHFCLGAPLARLEATAVLSAVTVRFPNARIAGEAVYKPNLTLRGLASLPVTV
ncbi:MULTISPECIES: cytochrome P450 [unclassified Mycolicibacterium]|uniref:cytochrome P450 n=1 Tax=unclassified Mycolicibacterium TaxID=2636767 RepID=UPI001F4BF62F|nr:cytochrome P450 [Mycolicibacterium sp. YH-1]UNB53180.1 cytochrome P450 [Mycolicibacterium sp. YH-1]